MKTNIDALMQARNLDALLVTGPGDHNPPMVYLTGGGHLTNADLVVPRGAAPLLFHASMERDEAAKTGLPTKNYDDYRYPDLLKQFDGDVLQATVARYKLMLADAGVTSGRVAVYGQIDAGVAYTILAELRRQVPELTITGELGNSLLVEAMSTKDEVEVERIRHMGQITTAVVGQTAEYLTAHAVQDGVLVKADGRPLTVGEVKGQINLWLAQRGAENPEGTIFAIGRDAGVPHSSGNPTDLLRLGQTIVYDIFPCEAGGGYFYDFTRTWCLGYAPDEALALYEDVLATYRQVTSELALNSPCKIYQQRTCELFEARGHPTVQTNPQTQEGYVHSLGHGVGLYIHERPRFSTILSVPDVLAAGSIFTIEPGLYYPERGLGVRLEDTYWARPDGKMEVLAEYPLDLVLPLK